MCAGRERRVPRWVVYLIAGKLVAVVLIVGFFVVAAAGAVSGGAVDVAPSRPTSPTAPGAVGDGTWDAGNIIADAVFYNATAMDAPAIQAFLDQVGGGCLTGCLRNTTYSWPGGNVAWCQPVGTGRGSFAQMLAVVSVACGINPQVSLVMIQKESQGLSRVPPAALTGFGCPDTGPGGSANCDSGSSGVWAQTWGMVQAFAHLKADPSRINYPVGQTSQILWNVVETGCGAGPVLVQNTATATLYTYTPYQPNAASLAAYPGEGDRCSAYGNRNFYRFFSEYFGSTGGGKPLPTGASGPGEVKACSPGQDRAALVTQVLASPNLLLRSGREASQTSDIQTGLECNTLALIASMETLGVQVRLNSLKTDHPVDGGYHPKGMAMDLGYPAGDPVGAKVYEFLYRNYLPLNVIQIIWAYPPTIPGIDPAAKCIQQDQNGIGAAHGVLGDCDALYPNDISGHADHIHVAIHL